MNNPIKPNSPRKPKKPSETITEHVKFVIDEVWQIEGETFGNIAEKIANHSGISVDDIDISKILIVDITFAQSDYWGDSFSMSLYYPCSNVPNLMYEKQMEKYKNDLENYRRKYSEYLKKLSKYKEDLKKYQKFQEDEELQKALDTLKKYGKTVQV